MFLRPIRRSPGYRRLSDITQDQIDELKRLSNMEDKEIKVVISEVKDDPKIQPRR